jgi:hypothetical protein
MKPRHLLVCFAILLASVSNLFLQADEPPQLPDQYAEVVLQVDGMI